ncbi:hypothetical protein H1C71_041689 [Ictidomys tridecemlineatus]|nr:hypothetical protein H1C71_041689 [Ictidomys tridecemlineatus]
MMLPPQSLESLESLISLERNLELLARPEAVGLRFQNLLGPMVQITFPSTSSLLCCPGLQCQLPPTCLLLIFQTESISHGQLSSLFFSVHVFTPKHLAPGPLWLWDWMRGNPHRNHQQANDTGL